MPKSKPKKQKPSEKMEPSLLKGNDEKMKEEEDSIESPVEDPPTLPIHEEMLTPEVFALSVGLRYGLEYWKLQTFGKALFPHIARAYVAWNLNIPFKTDIIFQQIERLDLDVLKDLETFESVLFPEIETYLAKKQSSK